MQRSFLFFDPDMGLVVQRLFGEVELSCIQDMLEKLYSFPKYSLGTRILTDLRGASAAFEIADVHKLSDFIKLRAEYQGSLRNAIVVDEPVTTAYTMMFQKLTKNLDFYFCSVFTTLPAACGFLDLCEERIVPVLSGHINVDPSQTLVTLRG